MARIANIMPPENWQAIGTEDMSRLADFDLYVTNNTFLKIEAELYSNLHVKKMTRASAALD